MEYIDIYIYKYIYIMKKSLKSTHGITHLRTYS